MFRGSSRRCDGLWATIVLSNWRAPYDLDAGRQDIPSRFGSDRLRRLVEHVLELDLALLETVRADVGYVIRDNIQVGLLGLHAARGGI